jgi:hypothetical protein
MIALDEISETPAQAAPAFDLSADIDVSRMSQGELIELGEFGLAEHLVERAVFAHARYGGLRPDNLETFLGDRECVRYPTRLVLEFGQMEENQFAQPEPDVTADGERGCALFVRPLLGKRPDYLTAAVAYMIPVINYGSVVKDDYCLIFGAALQGMTTDEFYRLICEIADHCGAEKRYDAGSNSAGCGCS